MKAIDSLLNLLLQQGGTELRLASGRPPQMFGDDVELPLTMPAMSADRIHYLLDELWSEHEAELRERGRLSVSYRSAGLGAFAVRLQQSDDRLDVSFRRARAEADEPEPGRIADAVDDPDGSLGRSDSEDAGTLPAAFAALLARVAPRGATDIHVSPHRAPVVRRNGALEVVEGEPGLDAAALLGTPAQAARVRRRGSVDRAFDVPNLGRIRVNVYASSDGLCAAVRILRREPPSLSDLNLPAQLEPLVDLPHGLVIACGPTGSGKSSTLAALVQHALRARPRVLVTLEDPIEYVIQPGCAAGLVRQREVGTHVRDFATGLRDALREDPDILLIGEMRDPETISLAITAAETGHLVFATLHSRTAPSAVERIVDIYPPGRQRQIRVQLADSLRAVIAQRLVPNADASGRVPAVELLRVTYGVANLIREGRTAQIVSALQAGGNDGMLVLERHLADLVRANRIRRETALAAANDAGTLADYLRGGG
jgi:twitching motility protein PilT